MAALHSALEAQKLVEERGYSDALYYVCNQIRKKKLKLEQEPASGHRQNLRIELNDLNEVKQAIMSKFK